MMVADAKQGEVTRSYKIGAAALFFFRWTCAMVILRILQEKYSFPSFGHRAKALALEWMSTQYVQNRYDLLPYFRPSQWTAERDVDRGKMRSLQIVP